jgi:hypothetical protein
MFTDQLGTKNVREKACFYQTILADQCHMLLSRSVEMRAGVPTLPVDQWCDAPSNVALPRATFTIPRVTCNESEPAADTAATT